jgi:molybdopterin synthase sulfur carrier subunit
VLAAVRARHGARSRLADVLAVCSVLVGDRPVGSRAPEDVSVWPGQTVEMLPPFAGG